MHKKSGPLYRDKASSIKYFYYYKNNNINYIVIFYTVYTFFVGFLKIKFVRKNFRIYSFSLFFILIKLLLTFKSLTVRRKAIKSALMVFNFKEVEKVKEIKEEKEKKEKVFTSIIISTTTNRSSITAITIRVIKRAFIFIKINIFINAVHRLIDFFYRSYK